MPPRPCRATSTGSALSVAVRDRSPTSRSARRVGAGTTKDPLTTRPGRHVGDVPGRAGLPERAVAAATVPAASPRRRRPGGGDRARGSGDAGQDSTSGHVHAPTVGACGQSLRGARRSGHSGGMRTRTLLLLGDRGDRRSGLGWPGWPMGGRPSVRVPSAPVAGDPGLPRPRHSPCSVDGTYAGRRPGRAGDPAALRSALRAPARTPGAATWAMLRRGYAAVCAWSACSSRCSAVRVSDRDRAPDRDGGDRADRRRDRGRRPDAGTAVPASAWATHRVSLRLSRGRVAGRRGAGLSRPGDPSGLASSLPRSDCRRPGPRPAPRPGRPGPAPPRLEVAPITVAPRSRSAVQSSTSVVASSADDTSSASSSSASQASARASASRCTWPPDSRTPRWPTSASGPPASLDVAAQPGRRRAPGTTSRSAWSSGDVVREGAGQHPRHLGDVGDPARAAGRPGGRRRTVSFQRTSPVLVDQAGQRAEQARLAGADLAEQQHQLAGRRPSRSTSLTPMVPSSWIAVKPAELAACGQRVVRCRAPGRARSRARGRRPAAAPSGRRRRRAGWSPASRPGCPAPR